ncbi:MAG: proprotein convertase P-domain-containing protein [Alphaproteobacteria bacterium]|nr:proprotein convertase P-domain-containing protein [Alphaproteobacteria bacterium]
MLPPLEDHVLSFSPAGLAAPESRLERSNNARYKTLWDVIQFCNTHGIPYVTDSANAVLPTALLQELFKKHYAVRLLPPTTLRHQGASTIIALESKNINNPDSYHGQVVSAIAGHVGAHLWPGVSSIFIKTDANPAFRSAFEAPLDKPLKALLEDQGVPVVVSCVDWGDLHLGFDHKVGDQFEHFWKATAFMVTSCGNDGLFGPNGNIQVPFQKHMAFSHASPLAVSVGAAEWGPQGFYIGGYSSANSPTFLAPVAPAARVKWQPDRNPEAIIGTSAAGPYAGGILASLNRRYGSYLTREQILFAVLATCDKTVVVASFGKHTPNSYGISYQANGAGLTYNAGPGGFGLINPHMADHLLAHMVALTQHNPDLITVPTEVRVELGIDNAHNYRAKDGYYYYDIELPDGYALKTTIEAEFTNAPDKDVAHGQIMLTSPSGTSFPMVTSRSHKHGVFNGLSTSHAWAGEEMGGRWRVRSTEPIKRLRISHHHFLEGDVIHNMNIQKLLCTPVPDLSDAVPLTELKPTLRVMREVAGQAKPLLPAQMLHVPSVLEANVARM